ncbi:MAG TPA: segregation/condensation protein A [Planctomycetota bacterium]|nr:segregation/condensation protein A [Planctomycetota bacterium]
MTAEQAAAGAAPLPNAPRESEVQVEAYRGPLDLLLHLIKEEEVDIYDIPIARILERYLRTIESLPILDINTAADFILMAATLMEIKSRQMLPPEQREALEIEEEDPRTDLVRQLLEYRRFREAADELGGFAERRALLFGRARFGQGVDFGEKPPADPSEELKEVTLYDLMTSFERLMKATLDDLPRTILYDDISVEERIEELKLKLAAVEQFGFRNMLREAADKADAAGMFVALLEAVRRRIATVFQPDPLGEIYVQPRGERPDSAFAPSAEEQDKLPTTSSLAARKGSFTAFTNTAEEEAELAAEEEFAGDAEGRKAVMRLEAAVRRAEEAVQRFVTGQKTPPAPLAVTVRQWDRPGEAAVVPLPAPSAASGAGEAEADVPGEPAATELFSEGVPAAAAAAAPRTIADILRSLWVSGPDAPEVDSGAAPAPATEAAAPEPAPAQAPAPEPETPRTADQATAAPAGPAPAEPPAAVAFNVGGPGMTPREIVKASLAFASPPRIVYGMDPEAGFPRDFLSVRRRPAPNSRATDWAPAGPDEERWDEWGNLWRRLGGITKGEPKVGVLEESWDQLDSYEFPRTDAKELYADAAERVKQLHSEGLFAFGWTDWPFNAARYLRRMDNFLADVLLEPERVKQLLGKLADMFAREIARYGEIGCDAVMACEDWGTQDRLLVSPECWRELFKPGFKQLCDAAHAHGMAVFLHSCGKNTEIIENWIEVGIDVCQFDQPELHGIDHLAGKFGGRMHFWCPVDIQHTLQTADEARIEAAAREYIEKLGCFGGGFIAGYYQDNEGIGLDPKWQAIASRAFMKYGDPAPRKRG